MDEAAVRIGEAAALYGLAPSTLRWWERQGVLAPPDRDGGQRQYSDLDLRRIGLAYLCCVTGGMPLDDAAVVASGGAGLQSWQRTVRYQVARLKQQMDKLRAAQDYLNNLLQCSDDDIAAQCRYLDVELITHTPRGRAQHEDLIAAARAASAFSPAPARESSRPPRDETRPALTASDEPLCEICGHPVVRMSRGRPRKYCSHACQQRAYRRRKRVVSQPGRRRRD